MGKRELITRELDRLPEQDVDRLLAFLRALKEAHADAVLPALAAETALFVRTGFSQRTKGSSATALGMFPMQR